MLEGTAYSQQSFSFLRSHGLLVGVSLLAYLLLQNVLVAFLAVFGLYDEYLSNAAFQNAVGIVFVTFGCLGMPFILLSLRKGSPSYHRVLPFNAPEDKAKSFYLICLGFAVCLVSNYCANWFEMLVGGMGFEMEEVQLAESHTTLDAVLNFITAAVAAPLVEEFVFRGVVMQPLRRYGDRFAIIASALVFGLCHGSPINIVFALVSGLVLGYTVASSKSLWVGIIIHFLNNSYAVLMYEMYRIFPEMSDLPYLISHIVVFAAGIAGFAALAVRGELKLAAAPSALSAGEKIRAFFLNIPMLIAVVILTVSMLTYAV